MRLSTSNLLKADAVITVVAFLLSGLLRNAKHGVAYVVGDIVWFTFLAGVLGLIVLGMISASRALRRRGSRATS